MQITSMFHRLFQKRKPQTAASERRTLPCRFPTVRLSPNPVQEEEAANNGASALEVLALQMALNAVPDSAPDPEPQPVNDDPPEPEPSFVSDPDPPSAPMELESPDPSPSSSSDS